MIKATYRIDMLFEKMNAYVVAFYAKILSLKKMHVKLLTCFDLNWNLILIYNVFKQYLYSST